MILYGIRLVTDSVATRLISLMPTLCLPITPSATVSLGMRSFPQYPQRRPLKGCQSCSQPHIRHPFPRFLLNARRALWNTDYTE